MSGTGCVAQPQHDLKRSVDSMPLDRSWRKLAVTQCCAFSAAIGKVQLRWQTVAVEWLARPDLRQVVSMGWIATIIIETIPYGSPLEQGSPATQAGSEGNKQLAEARLDARNFGDERNVHWMVVTVLDFSQSAQFECAQFHPRSYSGQMHPAPRSGPSARTSSEQAVIQRQPELTSFCTLAHSPTCSAALAVQGSPR